MIWNNYIFFRSKSPKSGKPSAENAPSTPPIKLLSTRRVKKVHALREEGDTT